MYALPHSRPGRVGLVMVAVLLFYPLYWMLLTLLPASWMSQVAVVLLTAVGVTGLVLSGMALRRGDRSVLLMVAGGLLLLVVLAFAVGESGLFGTH